ncbi:MAG: transcription-repair coupling factor [Pseudomonadales bacterium]
MSTVTAIKNVSGKPITGTHEAATSLAIYEASLDHDGFSLVITADTNSADQLVSELNFFSAGKANILSFPDWETLPYDSFSPHQDIVSQRLLTLYRLPQLKRGILVIPVTTLMQRTAPSQFVLGNSLIVEPGQQFDIQKTREHLAHAGYHVVDTVYEHGEFAVRGSIIDVFPMGSATPYRIDLFDDEVEQLRTFDPENQRTLEKVSEIRILPAREFPMNDEAIALFRQNWRGRFDADPKGSYIYQEVSSGITPSGVEFYLPLFFDKVASLFDYLPENTQVFTFARLDEAAEHYWQEINNRYEDRRYDTQRPLLTPNEIYLPVNELFSALKPLPRTKLLPPGEQAAQGIDIGSMMPPTFSIDHHAENPLLELKSYLQDTKQRTLFCAESTGRREILLDLLKRIQIKPTEYDNWPDFIADNTNIGITVGAIDRGLQLKNPALVIISESQLFGRQVLQRRRRSKARDFSDQVIRNLAELQIDAPVVHIDHGVGRYRGLETIDVGGQTEEFLTLEYAGESKLYVPIASLHLIARYTGASDETAPLHKLGTDKWDKAKRKAAEQVRDTAAELLEIHARRAARKGFEFNINENDYHLFSAGFPFEETPDQLAAIEATLADMESTQPMDRLVCGDVGFGKTEVAMRAAFVAAHSGKQVAMLVPTTLLAQQHYESFKDRFSDWPVNIDVISRFRTGKEQSGVEKKLASGQVDIVIGTHKLLSSNIQFKNLGLLIIDEEHRFGVTQKEKLKALRSEVDILTLTATPIPRTLNMAMAGIRDISIIASPPAKRLSIKTFVHRQDDGIRKEAINRELLRGGQVYVLHNDVSSIERKAREIEALIPEARVGFGHGQMRERDLEKVMTDFYHKRFNVLVCTTIIETGIDIPTANTIIIERADKFGLAQLHQLRGRVGRSHHQAYAYLLTPPPKNITSDAEKRLEAIANAQELGAGFTLATHDLEIRGAGELLGDNQSGNIHTIGFALYSELLDQAVNTLKQGKTIDLEKPLQHGAEVNLRLPALIPEDYLPDVHARLVMYKRISEAANDQDLRELQVEMIDRFGLLNEPIKNLFEITAIKLKAQQLGLQKIDGNDQLVRVEFDSDTKVNPEKLVSLIQSQPARYRLEGIDRLKYMDAMPTAQTRLAGVNLLLEQLST